MEKNVITQSVRGNGIVFVVRLVGVPVADKLFRAKHKHALVLVLVIFYHRKRRKGFAKTDAVRQNAAVVPLQFVDYGKGGVLLKIIQQIPYLA